jgi:hypothetical protein
VPFERRPKLESYRAKRRVWLTWLDTDEHHAIWTNLSAMAWTDVSLGIFRELAERPARKRACSGEFELKRIRRPLATYNVSRPLRQRCEAYRAKALLSQFG